jgi:uncharacterized Fe-S cluster-containing MiaB family protein
MSTIYILNKSAPFSLARNATIFDVSEVADRAAQGHLKQTCYFVITNITRFTIVGRLYARSGYKKKGTKSVLLSFARGNYDQLMFKIRHQEDELGIGPNIELVVVASASYFDKEVKTADLIPQPA